MTKNLKQYRHAGLSCRNLWLHRRMVNKILKQYWWTGVSCRNCKVGGPSFLAVILQRTQKKDEQEPEEMSLCSSFLQEHCSSHTVHRRKMNKNFDESPWAKGSRMQEFCNRHSWKMSKNLKQFCCSKVFSRNLLYSTAGIESEVSRWAMLSCSNPTADTEERWTRTWRNVIVFEFLAGTLQQSYCT